MKDHKVKGTILHRREWGAKGQQHFVLITVSQDCLKKSINWMWHVYI